jgi:hypothetical protein
MSVNAHGPTACRIALPLLCYMHLPTVKPAHKQRLTVEAVEQTALRILGTLAVIFVVAAMIYIVF